MAIQYFPYRAVLSQHSNTTVFSRDLGTPARKILRTHFEYNMRMGKYDFVTVIVFFSLFTTVRAPDRT